MRVREEEIRALGFDWPRSPEIEKNRVIADSLVDLDATLARLEAQHAFYDKQIGQMLSFARQWNAEVDDITDNRDVYGEARLAAADAIRHVKAVRDALLKRSPAPPGPP